MEGLLIIPPVNQLLALKKRYLLPYCALTYPYIVRTVSRLSGKVGATRILSFDVHFQSILNDV